LDKNFGKSADLQTARSQFRAIASFLEKEGIAHGDIQNGNIMMAPAGPKLIDYDGMYVPGMKLGDGTETGHKHFQHRARTMKISMWSEGLLKLKEQPSKSWVGRWVSVTGLLDPPFRSPRFGYTHLSITVQEDGQIQTLDDRQARFRLSSGTLPSIPAAGKPTTVTPASPPKAAKTTTTNGSKSAKSGPAISASKNQDIVQKFKAKQPQAPVHLPYSPPPSSGGGLSPSQSPPPISVIGSKGAAQRSFFNRVPNWAWVALVLVAILLIIMLSPPARKRAQETSEIVARSSSCILAEPPRSPGNAIHDSQPDSATGNPSPEPPHPPDGLNKTTPDNSQRIGGTDGTLSQSESSSQTSEPPIADGHAATGPVSSTEKSLLQLDRPTDASIVQRRLVELGFEPGTVNGDWNAQSRQALVDFQLVNGISRDRAFDMHVQTRLFSKVPARPIATTSTTYTGEWSRELSQCNTDGRTIISARRAEVAGSACDFTSIERESSAWRIKAKSVSGAKTHFANVRLLRSGSRLIWSSESGVTTYARCPRSSTSATAAGAGKDF
jgi:hypothetical protein